MLEGEVLPGGGTVSEVRPTYRGGLRSGVIVDWGVVEKEIDSDALVERIRKAIERMGRLSQARDELKVALLDDVGDDLLREVGWVREVEAHELFEQGYLVGVKRVYGEVRDYLEELENG